MCGPNSDGSHLYPDVYQGVDRLDVSKNLLIAFISAMKPLLLSEAVILPNTTVSLREASHFSVWLAVALVRKLNYIVTCS